MGVRVDGDDGDDELELELELELVTNFDFIRELPNEEVPTNSIPPSPFLHPQSSVHSSHVRGKEALEAL